MTYVKFTESIKVDGDKRYSAGDVVPCGEIPKGHLESMLRLGQCEPCDAPLELIVPPPGGIDLPPGTKAEMPKPEKPKAKTATGR